MFGSVATTAHSIDGYAKVAGQKAVDELRKLAEPLQGARLLQLSSPGASNAVRSLLQSAVPLFADLGLDVQWQQVRVSTEYLDMDRLIRAGLSGSSVPWSPALEAEWQAFNHSNAELFDEDYDIVVVHHTASVGLHQALTDLRGAPPPGVWLWDSHRDYRAALPQAWALIHPHADRFAGSVYDYRAFIRADAPTPRRVVIPPGVDPLGPRSRPVSNEVRDTILSQRGIDITRPIMGQIVLSMREDDPMRVLETYQLVKERRPDVQLVVVNLLVDGRELAEAIAMLREHGKEIGGVFVLTDLDRIGNVELSAIRDEATVLIHIGYPRGISIELLEEMWQGRPIVSGRSAVAEAVLQQERTGMLADTPSEQAAAVLRLLADPKEADRIGKAAHRRIAGHYLITQYLAGYLRLFQQCLRPGRRP